ncbi:MAG: aspartate kinase [Bacteroidales bacterium]|nr:aspartate kinase [Bacteroidales bacterium]
MIIMKFGGTSVADAEAILRMMSIVEEKLNKQPIIVVSALSKVTDTLYKICDYAERCESIEALMLVEHLRERHKHVADGLIAANNPLHTSACQKIDELCNQLKKLVEVICDLEELSDRSRARIIATGEYLSSNLIAFALNAHHIHTHLLDARKIVLTDTNHLKGEPDLPRISEIAPKIIQQALYGMEQQPAQALITQGFVSATESGIPTVLGRGGSDYTAAILGMAVQAENIEIWTDVDGIHTADPRQVKNTLSLPEVSFEEAAEMAHFGAKVLHPSTIEPAVGQNIPITVLNSQNPSGPGTRILPNSSIPTGVKSLSCKEHILVINIFSTRKINASGFLSRIFELFSDHHLPIDLISTSEANVSITLSAEANIDRLLEDLATFAMVFVETNKSQLSIVGKEMALMPDLHTRIFQTLAQEKIYMISQGAGLNNLSLVIDRDRLNPVMNQLHHTLFYHEPCH